MPARPYVLHEATYRQLRQNRPNVAVLPWGATEAHNYHLPHGTDVIEATALAERAAADATNRGAKVVVLPTIPFGNNAQQLDQVATISISTTTAAAILSDVAHSLTTQGIDRLVLLNAHGGNEFKPIVRDVQAKFRMLVAVINFWQMSPKVVDEIFAEAGDHAGELETSFLLHVRPDLVTPLTEAGEGHTNPFKLATADKGRRYFQSLCSAIADILVELSAASEVA